jgi:hypothetical protein
VSNFVGFACALIKSGARKIDKKQTDVQVLKRAVLVVDGFDPRMPFRPSPWIFAAVETDIPPAKVFQFHFHFQLNCNTTKPPLILTLSISL